MDLFLLFSPDRLEKLVMRGFSKIWGSFWNEGSFLSFRRGWTALSVSLRDGWKW